ncbi:MAG TPA: helix-turn-helix transcriptional regulator [Hyphomicrobiaceae bacterium]
MKSLPEGLRTEIRDARLAKDWSQLELGEKVGLGQKHVSGIETGKIVPRFDTLLDLLRALDLDVVVVPRALTPIVSSLAREHRNRAAHGTEDAERPLYASGGENDEEVA